MAQPVLNGVMKPADVIAKGPHSYNEATRKYEERQAIFSRYPLAMWNHSKREYAEAHTQEQERKMASEGWQTKPYPEQVAKETVVASPVNLAEVLLQQELEMKALKAQLEEMKEKRGPGRPKASEL